MDNRQNVIEKIGIKHKETVNDTLMIKIQEIAVVNGIETTFSVNEVNVVDALKKQIPRKAHISLKGTTDWNTESYCPVCREYLFDGQKYCSHCGQLIDWGFENK